MFAMFVIFTWVALTVFPHKTVASDPVLVNFAPASNVSFFDWLPIEYQWQILAQYAREPDNTATTNVPILFFPTTGNGLLEANTHPCSTYVRNPCCLVDFAEQYVSVGFFQRLSALNTLTRENCASISDLRPFIRSLVDAPDGGDSLILDALTGFEVCTPSHLFENFIQKRGFLTHDISHPKESEAGGPGV